MMSYDPQIFEFLFLIFCITNEISFTIISLSSSDKLFLESGFFIRNYYYITNYHRNLLYRFWDFICYFLNFYLAFLIFGIPEINKIIL